MPYQDLDSLESQPTTLRRDEDPQYRDDPGFDHLADTLSDQLQSLSGNTAKLSRETDLLGTKRDNARVRERVKNLREETMAAFKLAEERFQKVQTWENVNPEQKWRQTKLFSELKAILTEFQTVQRRLSEKQRAPAVAARFDMEDGEQPSGDAEFQLQEQQQLEHQPLANQGEVDYQQALIDQRDQQISEIDAGIQELSGLMNSVNRLVIEQAPEITNLFENSQNIAQNTQGANTELRSAHRYQKSARNKACCLFVILAIILTIIVLAVVLG